jgi:serine/threonine-protein kinase
VSDTLEHVASALVGCYAIGRELGRGGMATVFAATDLRLGREVAVKVLHRDLTVALGPARFKREIEIASSLHHPHILPVLDSGIAGGSLYLVMPLVTGESLHDLLVRERQLPVGDAVRVTREVASALAYAHERGIVHRDIKPENILMQDGHALVADFGIARAAAAPEKLTQTGLSLGTPTYMSPEQAAAERDLDGRSDQYSLACMLYEMLAGAPPYTAPTAQGLMARHALEPIPSISIMRSTVPDQIEDALYRALAKVPADRFPSVTDFADALGAPESWTTGSRPPRYRTSNGAVLPDRRRSRVRRAIYSAALTVPMLTAGWAGWRYWLRPPEASAASGVDAALSARQVAVLYLDDLSPDHRLTPIADGLTEALIDQLDRVEQLRVVSANGVRGFRGHDVAPDSIAHTLKVGTIVRGSVEPARDDGVQLTVSLLDAASGDRIATATFKQPAGGVLALRDSLSARVADFLRERIGDEVELRRARGGTANAAAWTLVRRGERLRRAADSLWHAGDTVTLDAALRDADSAFARSAALDPRWPEPLVHRGLVARERAYNASDAPAAGRWLDRADTLVARALALDPRSAAALELRGTLAIERRERGLAAGDADAERLLVSAEADLRAAVAIDRSRANAWNALSVVQYGRLNVAESNLAARRAYEADAYLTAAPALLWRLYVTSYDMEQFVDAARWCDEGRRRFPDRPLFLQCRLMLLSTKALAPDVDEAWSLVAGIQPLVPKPEWEYARREAEIYAAVVVARAGLADSARRVLDRARASRDVDPRGELMGYEAFARVAIGDREEAVSLLQRYLTANPEHRAGFAKANAWWWRDLQNDPRFKALIAGS